MPNLLRYLTLLCCFALLFACSDEEDQENVHNEKAGRTILMYVSAQNSLGAQRFHEEDSIEIANGRKYIKKNDRLLVFMDDSYAPRIYQYTAHQKQPKIVRSWQKDVNSAAPEVLQDVLSWTKANFPAEEYAMVMWSHSDGWLPSTNKDYRSVAFRPYSFGIDVGPDGNMDYDRTDDGKIGAQMDIDDMAKAIQQSGVHLKYIFFDSCLMQNLEVAFSLRQVTDFLIAGPMQIPGHGANYTHMLEKGLFTRAEYDIIDTYVADERVGLEDDDQYNDYGVVISSIRTDQMEALAQTTADVLSRSTLMNRQSPDLSHVLNYQAYTSNYFLRPHNYDVQEAMKAVLSKADFEIYEKALQQAIVHKGATNKFWIGPYYDDMQSVDLDNYCGVSAFIPQSLYQYNAQFCIYGDLNKVFQSTSWYKAAGWAQTGW